MMDPGSRRQFLRFTVGGGLFALAGFLFKSIFWPAPLDAAAAATLERFADVLIPRDQSPSASDLRLVALLNAEAAFDRRLVRILRRGASWLDRSARSDFGRDYAELDDASADHIAQVATSAPIDAVERIFFERARIELFSLYYSRPESWSGLPASLPPQPLGFVDFASPPRA
jgi:hypothetical protein